MCGYSRPFVKSGLLLIGLVLVPPPTVRAGHGIYPGYGHHGHHSRDRHYFGISPGGISYGFSSKGFGFSIGPVPGPYYRTPRYHASEPYPRAQPYPAVRSQAVYRRTEMQQKASPVIAASGDAANYQLLAEQAFGKHDYEEAVRRSRHAVVEDPRNGKLHLFLSQSLFAVGDYAAAAAAVHSGLSLLDRRDWGYVVDDYHKFYTNNDYVTQMNRLIDFIQANPEVAYARFLRGYHYVFLGHEDAARRELTKALLLQPRDELAADLLVHVGGEVPAEVSRETLPTPAPAVASSPGPAKVDGGEDSDADKNSSGQD